MTPKKNLERIGLMTTKRNLQNFPIGNQPKQFVRMKIKEMPEFQEVVNALTDYEQLQQEVIDRQETEESLTRELIKLGDNYEQLQRDVKRFMELRKALVVGKTYTNATDFENNMKEKNELEEKLSKVGKGE